MAVLVVGEHDNTALRPATLNALMPKAYEVIMNTAFEMFPDSAAAQGKKDEESQRPPTREAMIFATIMRGIHW